MAPGVAGSASFHTALLCVGRTPSSKSPPKAIMYSYPVPTVLLMCTIAVVAIASHAYANLERRDVLGVEGDEPIKKRPFCNAFTGCGKKRSENPSDADEEANVLLEKLGRQLAVRARMREALRARLEAIDAKTHTESDSRQWPSSYDLLDRKRRSSSGQVM